MEGSPANAAENIDGTVPVELIDFVVITGFSGAGKSTAIGEFEDEGYFCVDNLPPEMIGSLAHLFSLEGSKVERAAVVCDVRGRELFSGLAKVIDDLKGAGMPLRMLFLEADQQTLVTRYKETRRRHPLAVSGSVAEGVVAEAELLPPLRERADIVVDTGGLTAASLRRRIGEEVIGVNAGRMSVTFESFGFKHGPPRDADLLFDVRFLPNPHYDPDLRPLTGRDQRVVDYINSEGDLAEFFDVLHPFLDHLLPRYLAEGKNHMVVAVGCTGGRHRSVAIVESLVKRYTGTEGLLVDANHRDADRQA
ncbi:MAG: RNase adapter RapZ [Actinomycetes bacterium]